VRQLFIALLTASLPVTAQSTNPAIDSLMARYASPAGPGASVLVVRNGKVVYQKGYGLADVEKGIPVTPETNFRLASLSKQFTATAVMLLIADRKLRYDDSLTALLTDVPAYARGVTVRQLLNHTSGLPDYEDFVPDSQTRQVHDGDVPGLIAQATAMKFAPGTRYDYSNTGYALLALIVERRSGKRYADFLNDRIFKRLGMKGTVALEEGRSVVKHRAYGHRVDSAGTVRRTDQSNTSAVLGDGGIYSSTSDLAKWERALERHTLLSKQSLRQAWTSGALASGDTTGYGFGMFVDRDAGTLRLRHHGQTRGFTNGIVRYPERRVTVIVLTNRSGGAPWDIAQRIAEMYLSPPLGSPAPSWRP
jgi:CubicO group peptidase (beta-lactamase class C family)